MLKEEELVILSRLRNNSRTPATVLAERGNISRQKVTRALQKLEEDVVLRYASIIDTSKLSLPIKTAFILRGSSQNTAEFIMNNPAVNTVLKAEEAINPGQMKIGTEPLLIVESSFKTMNSMAEFADQLAEKGVSQIREHHIVQEVARENFLTADIHVSELLLKFRAVQKNDK